MTEITDTSFYLEEELANLGIKKCGTNVKISRKCSIYGGKDIEIGDHVRIDDFCILSGKIVIGNYVHIAAYSALYGGREGIFISNYASISSRVTIYSISDDYSGEGMTNPMIPEKFTNVQSKPVYIGKHVIIGSTSVVLPGVNIAEGSAFGSFSFINRDSGAWSMNVGVPFKKIKERNKKIKEIERQFVREQELEEK